MTIMVLLCAPVLVVWGLRVLGVWLQAFGFGVLEGKNWVF